MDERERGQLNPRGEREGGASSVSAEGKCWNPRGKKLGILGKVIIRSFSTQLRIGKSFSNGKAKKTAKGGGDKGANPEPLQGRKGAHDFRRKNFSQGDEERRFQGGMKQVLKANSKPSRRKENIKTLAGENQIQGRGDWKKGPSRFQGGGKKSDIAIFDLDLHATGGFKKNGGHKSQRIIAKKNEGTCVRQAIGGKKARAA